MHSVASARGTHAVRRNRHESLDVNVQFRTGSVKSSVQLCMDMNLPLLIHLTTINDTCAPPLPGFSALSRCRTCRGASLHSRIQKTAVAGIQGCWSTKGKRHEQAGYGVSKVHQGVNEPTFWSRSEQFPSPDPAGHRQTFDTERIISTQQPILWTRSPLSKRYQYAHRNPLLACVRVAMVSPKNRTRRAFCDNPHSGDTGTRPLL